MRKTKPIFVFLLSIFLIFPGSISAAKDNYITPVFPVRARSLWRQGNDISHLKKLVDLVSSKKVPSTWMLQYDVLSDSEVVDMFRTASPSATLGIFMEVSKPLASDSQVEYNETVKSWSAASRVFLSGYDREDRQRMIDQVFKLFKEKLGYYPKSYGSWYVDVWSMEYIRDTYSADIVLGLADQYSTDGYQTWGQYINSPYFVSSNSAIEPAGHSSDSTRVLKVQWAPREPLLGLGENVDSSNFSLQVNDYFRGKGLDTKYFTKLVSDITVNVPGEISQAVYGIEAGELELKYFDEISRSLDTLLSMQKKKQLSLVSLEDFNIFYRQLYGEVSPPGLISSTVLDKTVNWYFSPNYRLGIETMKDALVIRDLRFYNTLNYRDNDQLFRDTHNNLVRLVSAKIDSVTLKNEIRVGTPKNLKINQSGKNLEVIWENGRIVASPSAILFSEGLERDLNDRSISFIKTDTGLLVTPPVPAAISTKSCSTVYGNYTGRFPCVKKAIAKLAGWQPDFVYSKLENRHLFGVRTSRENFFGIGFPAFRIGSFTYPVSIMNSFLSTKAKLTPKFEWTGRQELELEDYKSKGIIWEKGHNYSQDELLKKPQGKIVFENGYYVVYSNK